MIITAATQEILESISPILYALIVVVIIISLGRSILKGDFKNIPIQLVMCCVSAYLVWKPEQFMQLGKLIVGFIIKYGGELIG